MIFNSPQGNKIFYETHGNSEDPAIILLHALGADHKMWNQQIDDFVEAGYYVITPDLRGHGSSDNAENFSIEECSKDLNELTKEIKIPEMNILGVNIGGTIAQRFTIDNLDKVNNLVLEDTFSGPKGGRGSISALISSFSLKLIPKSFVNHSIIGNYKGGDMDEVMDYFEESLQNTEPSLLKKAKVEMNDFNVLNDLQSIDVPTLVIVGGRNTGYFKGMTKETADGLPNSKHLIFEEGKDPCNMVVPEKFNKEVIKFLKG